MCIYYKNIQFSDECHRTNSQQWDRIKNDPDKIKKIY